MASVPPLGPLEQHFYRLEHLFQTLHELSEEQRAGLRVGPRWMRAVAGFTALGTLPEVPNALTITLVAGSRMCDEALASLQRQNRPDSDTLKAGLTRMRDLLIAAHDLIETRGPDAGPAQRHQAQAYLADLLHADSAEEETLLIRCFAHGSSCAAEAIASLQRPSS